MRLSPYDSTAAVAPIAQSSKTPVYHRVVMAWRIVQVRLRFLLILAAVFLVVGKWSVIRNRWDKLTQSGHAEDMTAYAVSQDTEYFCPMDPGVVSDWSGKCGICNMTLVRRKKGEATALPDGVVARMQLSPYRLQQAGIQTSLVTYRPLAREVVVAGFVECDELSKPSLGVDISEREMALVTEGMTASVSSEAFPGRSPFVARVTRMVLSNRSRIPSMQVRLEIDDLEQELRSGMLVAARILVPAAGIEPFRSMSMPPPPIRPGDLREVFICTEHPDVLRDRPGKCPLGRNELERHPLASHQRLEWWCPMHPKVTADKPAEQCRECNGMKLLPRVLSFSPAGEVLAVPESAVIDTGSRKLVYVERSPGMFDGVEVVIGPRCGEYYPLVRGLEAGQRVATAGSFLIDAETRLNPRVSVGYFGAARNANDGLVDPKPGGSRND